MSDRDPPRFITGKNAHFQPETYWKVFALYQEKYSAGRISKTLNLNRSTILNIFQRIKKTGLPLPKKGLGPSKKLNEDDIEQLNTIIRNDPYASYAKIREQLQTHSIDICERTLAIYIKQLGYQYNVIKGELMSFEGRYMWSKSKASLKKKKKKNVYSSPILE
ncbi:hypothetical protein BY458DRAFT_516979 [Sporodiniella umbellata]|nr:hypothetical protein BY458DRAFT_516979 [Sporodiniella umbellata]